MPEPKVSVLLLTRNHEPFIAQALESVLEQQTAFPVEIIVGEDASTDQTRALVEQYARRYPGRVRPLYHPRNVGAGANLRACLAAARGEYLAMLEGDDYWTDPQKLALQVQWLDAHPDFTICFHPVTMIRDEQPVPTAEQRIYAQEVYGFADFLIDTVPHTGSVVLRNCLRPVPNWVFAAFPLDFPLVALYAERGRAYLLPRTMGVYRLHAGGSWSAQAYHWRAVRFLRMYRRLVAHYARTPRAGLLRSGLCKQYLTIADQHLRHRNRPQDTYHLRKAAGMWQAYTPRHLRSLLGVSFRWLRSRLHA